jgi:DNA-directed RNA polymerase specialized sigma24 family protein
MPDELKMTAAESAELQKLYAALPEAIAEAVEALPLEHLSSAEVANLLEGDSEVDTIISRIRQITEPKTK